MKIRARELNFTIGSAYLIATSNEAHGEFVEITLYTTQNRLIDMFWDRS